MLGTNDLIHKPRPTADQIARGLVKLKQLAEAGTVSYSAIQKQRILFVVPAPLRDTRHGPFKDDFDNQAIKESRYLAQAFLSEGKRIGVPVFDAGSVVEAEGIDGVHLSESGHRLLGEAIAREVKALVHPLRRRAATVSALEGNCSSTVRVSVIATRPRSLSKTPLIDSINGGLTGNRRPRRQCDPRLRL